MAQIITVDFRGRKVIDRGLDRFEESARRCELRAAMEPEEIAASLRRCAAKYRRAEGGGA